MRARHHVLVVEDHADSAEVLATFLRSLGHEVTIAEDGETALALLDRIRPAIAIVDIGLGVMDGFTLAERLRARLGDEITIIALSAFSAPEQKRRAREVGIDTYLTKPVDLIELEALLESVATPKQTK